MTNPLILSIQSWLIFNQNFINIRNLSLESPEVSPVFDVEKCFTEADFKGMKKVFETLNSQANTIAVFSVYEELKTVSPDRFSNLEIAPDHLDQMIQWVS